MRRIVASGELGALGMIAAWNYTNFLYRPRRPEELDTAQGGGILFNQVPHQIDMVRTIVGRRLRSVRAQATKLDPARPTEGSAARFSISRMARRLRWRMAVMISLTATSCISGFLSAARRSRRISMARRAGLLAAQKAEEARLRVERYAYGSEQGTPPSHQPHFGLADRHLRAWRDARLGRWAFRL